MLTNLSIKNYALIEDISLDFNKGMTVITGETGAGKSIIIQAVDLLLGARASASSIRTGSSVCSLSARFDISKNPAAQKMLEELAIEHDGEIIVRRNLDVSGKSKAFINDMPVSVSGLYDIGRLLIDFYSQHKSNMLFDGNYQRQIIDDVAKNEKLLKQLNDKYLCLTQLLNKKNSLMLSQSERERMADLYNFQLQEITKADLRADEEIKIEAELPKLKNAEKIQNLAAEIANNLYKQDKSVLESLSKTIKQIDMLGQLGINTQTLSKTINEAFIQIDDIYREINNISQNIDVNPSALNGMLEKQQLIKKLKSKYSKSVEDILKYKE
ncbi:MAG: AAA family ATPase, partial [Endomicrobiaceae bacterium]|nr:AAA family ATPase [Endomicrobiaceae bacterium]